MTEHVDFNALVDRNLIQQHDDKRKRHAERLGQAVAGLAAAKEVHAKAHDASVRAIEGEGKLSPIDAENELTKAATALTVAQKVYDAAHAAHEKAQLNRNVVQALAWKPVYTHGIKMRLAASKKGDLARAMLAEAEADHLAGTAVLNKAAENGVPHIGHQHHSPHQFGSHDDEAQKWASAGLDLNTFVHPWDPGPV